MFQALQVATLVLVAVSLTFALAHAAELPGKLRLSREAYLAVQSIYYPGFTIGGASEPFAIIALAALLVFTPWTDAAFWWTAGALVAQMTMHAVCWLMTHPVNNFWLKDIELRGLGANFFAAGAPDGPDLERAGSWTALWDRWEFSHVLRAAFGATALVLAAIAVTVAR